MEGQLVDVLTGEIYPARVSMKGGMIARIERLDAAPPRFILPGLIDAHIHVESSLLTPYRFAEAAVVRGTTSVVTNPHEVANVAGMEGIEFMVRDGMGAPLRAFYTVPSCVPSTDRETAGAVLGVKEVERLLQRDEFVALGEVMDYHGVLAGDTGLMAKIGLARMSGKPVDGHCPGLRGEMLRRYVRSGITTDHECTEPEEALEKHGEGMTIMVREGSASRDLEALLPFARSNKHFLVTDDLQASDLLHGHLDVLLAKAVKGGTDPVHALRAVTLWPAEHYGLPGGSIKVGRVADAVIVEDLKRFKAVETWIGGRLVARAGKRLFEGTPSTMPSHVPSLSILGEDLVIDASGDNALVRVIEASPGRVTSRAGTAVLAVAEGRVLPDPAQDVLKLVVINRYARAKPAAALVRGFGLRSGALASTVAHDSHNLIAVGADDASLATAINGLCDQGGGFLAVARGTRRGLELPVAGLMSDRPCREVARRMDEVNDLVRAMGCPLPAPFVTLSFQSLLVVPELKLGDRGLFDSVGMRFVDPVIERDRDN